MSELEIPKDLLAALTVFAKTHALLVIPRKSTVVEITLDNGEKVSFPLGERMNLIKQLARGNVDARGNPAIQDRNQKRAAVIRDELVTIFADPRYQRDENLVRLLREEEWWTKEGSKNL